MLNTIRVPLYNARSVAGYHSTPNPCVVENYRLFAAATVSAFRFSPAA